MFCINRAPLRVLTYALIRVDFTLLPDCARSRTPVLQQQPCNRCHLSFITIRPRAITGRDPWQSTRHRHLHTIQFKKDFDPKTATFNTQDSIKVADASKLLEIIGVETCGKATFREMRGLHPPNNAISSEGPSRVRGVTNVKAHTTSDINSLL